MSASLTTKALAGWFGSNRILAPTVGMQLGRCEWVGVPFCGGCSELPHIKARTGVASDLHRHLINLARCIRDRDLKDELARRLAATPFHPDELEQAQERCRQREATYASIGQLFGGDDPLPDPHERENVDWAYDYFICCWMGRGGFAGTVGEFSGTQSVRWNASGGDSATRFRSAAASLDAWCKIVQPWNFVVLDAFDFLKQAKDQDGHGLYVDAPWPEVGDDYRHHFCTDSQVRLARELEKFQTARVVVRYGDHPLIRELYPSSRWTWVRQASRDRDNKAVAEVLILNGPSYTQ